MHRSAPGVEPLTLVLDEPAPLGVQPRCRAGPRREASRARARRHGDSPLPGAGSRGGCRARFASFDADGDGRVSEDEFLNQAHRRTDPGSVFLSRDRNGDGMLNVAEFCSMRGKMRALRPWADDEPIARIWRRDGTPRASDCPMEIDIGIDAGKREQIAGGLSKVLADSYTLYLKTHNFHWNVTGPMFQTLHLMFETQYTELALAVDAIAERIRALGFPAPGTYRKFSALTSIEEEADVPRAEDMIRRLVHGHETVARTARSVFAIAEAAHDQPTCDLLTVRLQVHEKTAWMLRSLLE